MYVLERIVLSGGGSYTNMFLGLFPVLLCSETENEVKCNCEYNSQLN